MILKLCINRDAKILQNFKAAMLVRRLQKLINSLQIGTAFLGMVYATVLMKLRQFVQHILN
jgi:hypothetical protein